MLWDIDELEIFKVDVFTSINVLYNIVGFEPVKVDDWIKEFNIEFFDIILETKGFVDFINIGISLCISFDLVVFNIVENWFDKIVDSRDIKEEVWGGLIIDEAPVIIVDLIGREKQVLLLLLNV